MGNEPSQKPVRTNGFLWAAGAFVLLIEVTLHLLTPWHPYIVWVLSLSGVTFAFYGFDKARAAKTATRIPEKLLHSLSLLGGFPGGWLGRTLFRHKTRKVKFLAVLIVSTAIHAVLIYLFFT